MNVYDVVGLGELLIDFTFCSISAAGMKLFEQNPGGAPANVMCAISKLGGKTAFIGKVGQDMHGTYLRDVLQTEKVDIQGLIIDPEYFTTLAFVELNDAGERSFSFARKPGADTRLKPSELAINLLKNTKVFHFGSLSLTHEPARSATYEAIRQAKDAGAIISYDPNYRAPLWESQDQAVAEMRSALHLVDVIKISDEETELLTGESSPEKAAQVLLNKGIGTVVVTLGKHGALIMNQRTKRSVQPHDCTVVDTTGAGDAFWGGFLYKLAAGSVHPQDLSERESVDYVVFANAVATHCVQKRGAIPAMPDLDSVMKLYQLSKS